MPAEPTIDRSRVEVQHEPALSRYTVWLDDRNVGLLDYVTTGREIRFTHSEVDPAERGQGLASILTEFALDDVRARTDLPVVPACPYVDDWIDAHAEYQDLLTRGR
ncbi:GNAT family N-acetyltransferase [Cryobacterium tepidiphilum]|jgi:predicted GNAT family acetyltransferase|uniref:N-acetyltransferase n=1 Tax=Cryobacterium tepidiphilum TaxID=2486026 RepID=A0A3M8KUN4_9MICO|nr:GNAT family N-acetyltransferase [Cryobacterium tepidiphilum]RNE56775.1 N-acetyltransferase [Cryobacterium tepidiphilum]